MAIPTFHWEKSFDGQEYVISNNLEMISYEFIQSSLARKEVYWTGPTISPLETIKTMVVNSCTLGLYKTGDPTSPSKDKARQIGFARIITDYVTIAYLTDVFILPECQGTGLGKWLIARTREIIDSMPELRRSVLLTDQNGKGVKFYERELGMKVFNTGDNGGKVVMMRVNTSS
ncbi:hypothetical protein EJ08DRAFT_300780 [Tothia fuscella]|uniref:N-acetyltransferase domain-containing protein n=1 Tax=Tothia fuscella TaxID=1048955 RepID=A0A9P4NPK1_9PEZI|nr:hypothetical protein EJ08DRAFT_300780 [Tothia fuscella]